MQGFLKNGEKQIWPSGVSGRLESNNVLPVHLPDCGMWEELASSQCQIAWVSGEASSLGGYVLCSNFLVWTPNSVLLFKLC